jgi:hypothetical protein
MEWTGYRAMLETAKTEGAEERGGGSSVPDRPGILVRRCRPATPGRERGSLKLFSARAAPQSRRGWGERVPLLPSRGHRQD